MRYLLTYYSPDGEFCQSIEDRSSLVGKIDFICNNDGYRETRIYEIHMREVVQRGWAYDKKLKYLMILDRYLNTLDTIDKEA